MTHLEQLLQVGVLTGSRAFNVATPESDWDIVILESNCRHIEDMNIINDTMFTNWNHIITDNGKLIGICQNIQNLKKSRSLSIMSTQSGDL